MSWNAEEARQIGRIEEKVDTITAMVADHETRLRTGERWRNRLMGASFVIGAALTAVSRNLGMFLIPIALLVTGCAISTVTRYNGDGTKSVRATSLAVFRNTIDVRAPAIRLRTHRPGLSDNGLKGLEMLPELAEEIGQTITGTQALDLLKR